MRFILIIGLLCIAFASGATLNCSVTEDAEFDEDGSTTPGLKTGLFADLLDGSGEQPWLGFDGCVNQITTGSTINNAVLHFYTSSGSDENLQIWQYQNQTWDETEVDGYCPGSYCTGAKNRLNPLICTMTGTDGSDLWQTSCNLSGAVATELAAGNDRVSFVLNNTGDASDYYNVRSKEDGTGLSAPWLYITYTEPVATGGKTLYINQNHSACSDSYTRLENNLTHPWCTFDEMSKLECNDTLQVIEGTNGTYHIEGSTEYLQGMTCTSGLNITIEPYPGDTIVIGNWERCSSWTDDSASWSGENVWECDDGEFAGGTSRPRATLSDNTPFFRFQDSDDFTNTNYENSIYTNTGTGVTYVKLSGSRDPNDATDSPYIANTYEPLTFQNNDFDNDTFIIMRGFTFNHSFYALRAYDGNIIFEDNIVNTVLNGLKIDGDDGACSHSIVRNNTFDAHYPYRAWYGSDMKEDANMENSPVYADDIDCAVDVLNNSFYNSHGAILLYADDPTEYDGSLISGNYFENGSATQIEIESYCRNTNFTYNQMVDCQFGISIAPANATASEHPCIMAYNRVSIPKNYYTTGESTDNQALKIDARTDAGANHISNWNIHHNTFYGEVRGINHVDASSDEKWGYNNTWKNNIIVSNTSYAVLSTGLESDDNEWNYNLYYDIGATYLLGRYNSQTAVNYASLADAISGGGASWDADSTEADPLFLDYKDLVPSSGSPACTMGSDGGYVGALSCAPDTTSPTFDHALQNVSIDYDNNINYDINASDDTAVDCFAVNDTKFSITCAGVLTMSTVSEGTHYLEITVNDTSSNNATATMWVEVNVSLKSGLVLNYSMSSDTDPVCVDTSGSGNNGTITDAVWTGYGLTDGGAMSFDGDGDFIYFSSIEVAKPFTLSTWVYPKSYKGIYSDYRANRIGIMGDVANDHNSHLTLQNVVGHTNSVWIEDSTGDSSESNQNVITLNVWQMISVIVNTTGNACFYVDGILDKCDNEIIDNITINRIGRGYAMLSFNGTIDEVLIWNRSLSATEISQLYETQKLTYSNTMTVTGDTYNNTNTNWSMSMPAQDISYYNTTWWTSGDKAAVLVMDYNIQNATDLSGQSNHGTVTDATYNGNGGFDGSGAYVFDGDGDYIDTSTIVNEVHTLSAWIQRSEDESTTEIKTIIYCADGIELFVRLSKISIYGTTFEYSTTNIQKDEYYHVVVTRNGTNTNQYIAYINGNPEIITTRPGTITSTYCTIGRQITGYFNGTIDHVMIFNYSLSPEQVYELYNATAENRPVDLKAEETSDNETWTAYWAQSNGVTYDTQVSYALVGDAPDIIAPTLSNLAIETTTTSATISYDSSEYVNTYIEYGETSDLGTQTANSTGMSHIITISGLDPGIYMYNITACDNSSNCYETGPGTFSTESASSSGGSSGGTTTTPPLNIEEPTNTTSEPYYVEKVLGTGAMIAFALAIALIVGFLIVGFFLWLGGQ